MSSIWSAICVVLADQLPPKQKSSLMYCLSAMHCGLPAGLLLSSGLPLGFTRHCEASGQNPTLSPPSDVFSTARVQLPLMHLKSGRAFSAVGVDAWSSAQACPSQHWVGAQHSAWEVALVFDTFIGALLKVVLSSPPVGSHFSLKEQ